MKLSEKRRMKIIGNTCTMVQKGTLQGSTKMIMDTPSRLLAICNGLGAKGSFFRIPAKIWGTSILESTLVHDYDYEMGRDGAAKHLADSRFKTNMYKQIEIDCLGKWYKPEKLMKLRANSYYQAVVKFGQEAYNKKVFPGKLDIQTYTHRDGDLFAYVALGHVDRQQFADQLEVHVSNVHHTYMVNRGGEHNTRFCKPSQRLAFKTTTLKY